MAIAIGALGVLMRESVPRAWRGIQRNGQGPFHTERAPKP